MSRRGRGWPIKSPWKSEREGRSGNDGDIGAIEVDLAGLERVPSEGHEGVRREVLGDLDLLGDGVSASSGRPARVERGIINSLALAATIEGLASEPIVPPAWLALLAIGAEIASLSTDVGTLEGTSLEAVLGSLLLFVGWGVSGSEELVDEGLVLAYTVAEHSSVVAVGVDAPLNVDDLTWLVDHDGCLSPSDTGSVVVDIDTGVEATRTAATNLGGGHIRPCLDGLEDGAFRAGIFVRLDLVSVSLQ